LRLFNFNLTFLSLLVASPLWAGTQIKALTQSYTGNSGEAFETSVITTLDQGRMRMDLKGPNGRMVMIYDQKASLVDWVDPVKKSVIELTVEDLSDMKPFVATLAAWYFKLNHMDPDPGGPEGGAKSYLSEFSKPYAAGVRYGGFTCDEYRLKRGRETAGDFWMVPPSGAGLPQEDFQTYQGLLNLLFFIGGDAFSDLGIDTDQFKLSPPYQEFPVQTSFYRKGSRQFVYRVLDLHAFTPSPNFFTIPSSYKKTDVLTWVKMLIFQQLRG
jgi:hypothetical protein